MNDRELLELAAKAAGVKLGYNYGCDIPRDFSDIEDKPEWNPLTDDGDRYRLARTLKMTVNFEQNFVDVPLHDGYGFFIRTITVRAPTADEAIVRAAAEIGQGME